MLATSPDVPGSVGGLLMTHVSRKPNALPVTFSVIVDDALV